MFYGKNPRIQRHHNSSAAPHPTHSSFRDQSLEPRQTLPISYPESSQRTRIQDGQFASSREEFVSAQNTHFRKNTNDVLFPGSQFSSMPIPSDRPPPPLRPPGPPPSFPNAIFPPIYASSTPNEHVQSFSRVAHLNSYHDLSSSVTDSEDDFDHGHHHPSNFIPIVPTPQVESSPLSFDASEENFLQSSPQSTTSDFRLSPPPQIETIPPPMGLRVNQSRRPNPKMHTCKLCGKQFPRPSGLETHMNIHTNARPYPCEFPGCPKTFGVRSNARRHYRTHSGTTPLVNSTAEPFKLELNFKEIVMPKQDPPPPLSLSRSPFRLRWVAPNLHSRTAGVTPQNYDNDTQNAQNRIHGIHDSMSLAAPFVTDNVHDTYYDQDRPWDAHTPGAQFADHPPESLFRRQTASDK